MNKGWPLPGKTLEDRFGGLHDQIIKVWRKTKIGDLLLLIHNLFRRILKKDPLKRKRPHYWLLENWKQEWGFNHCALKRTE